MENTLQCKTVLKANVFNNSRELFINIGITLMSLYLTPGACEPFYAILTRSIVTDLGVCRSLTATSLQRKAADVVCQAEHSPCTYSHPTFSWALWRSINLQSYSGKWTTLTISSSCLTICVQLTKDKQQHILQVNVNKSEKWTVFINSTGTYSVCKTLTVYMVFTTSIVLHYPVSPLSVEPALGTCTHVTIFYIDRPQVHVALLIRNKVPHVADTAYLPWLLSIPTWDRALWGHRPHD